MPNTSKTLGTLLVGFASVATAFGVHAQTLITAYTFDGGAGAGTFNPTTVASGNTASKWSATGTASSGSGSLSATLDFVDRSGVNFAPFSEKKAATTKSWPSFELSSPGLKETVYEGFTVKPNSGSLSLNDIKFDVGTGTGNDLIGNLKVEVLVGGVIQASKTLSSSGYGNGIDFSFAPVIGTPLLPIEFRFLAYNAKENDSPIYLDNVKAYGTNVVVPEPTTYAALAGVALLGFAAFRRVRK